MRHRLRLAWNILRGRPTLYRIRIVDGGIVSDPGTMIWGAVVKGTRGAAVTMRHDPADWQLPPKGSA